ncbi:hypothetical protein F0562_023135 [Nyssa sinensis]|uniref:Uncharacterized protein n=1 Tax=Nyssa sinensis TaxID=561372 RepID=A0A5J5BFR9_9ASTE|nr:hypothetical protein F0562_023135 [Nyssa sinensis]
MTQIHSTALGGRIVVIAPGNDLAKGGGLVKLIFVSRTIHLVIPADWKKPNSSAASFAALAASEAINPTQMLLRRIKG